MSDVIKSFFKIEQDFVLVDEFTGKLPDKNYIEGAIHCQIDGRELFTMKHWDLVDQLWCYIIDGLSKAIQGLEYDSSFPDQPLRLRFKPLSKHEVEVTVGKNTHTFDVDSLAIALSAGAIQFLTSMKKLLPEFSDTWDRYLSVSRSIHQHSQDGEALW